MKGYVLFYHDIFHSEGEIAINEGVYLDFDKALDRLTKLVTDDIMQTPYDFMNHNYPFEEEDYEIKEEVFALYENEDLETYEKAFKETYQDVIKQFCKNHLIGESYNLWGLTTIQVFE